MLQKIERMYARVPKIDPTLPRMVLKEDTRKLSLSDESIDAIISSPPYFDALDYGRDNRLRLWFLGVNDYKVLDQELITDASSYLEQMSICLKQLHRVLRPHKYCVLVLGDVERHGTKRPTAMLIADLHPELFSFEQMIEDTIPDERRARRRTKTTKIERILILRRK